MNTQHYLHNSPAGTYGVTLRQTDTGDLILDTYGPGDCSPSWRYYITPPAGYEVVDGWTVAEDVYTEKIEVSKKEKAPEQ